MAKFALAAGATLFLALFPSEKALADVSETSRQTTPSGPGNYNLQLRNIKPLQVITTGDGREEGELRSVSIRLTSEAYEFNGRSIPRQFDARTYTRPYVWSSNGRPGNLSYLSIKQRDMVTLGNPRGPEPPDDLWVITRYTYGPDHEASQKLYFTIEVTSRELDCAGKRVCRRGDSGTWIFRGSLPIIWAPPYTCERSNTFKIEPVDGQLRIIDPGAVRQRTSVRSTARQGWVGDGPFVALFNADLCVTRSTREPWSQNPDRVFREQRDKADQIGRRNRDRIGRDLKND